MDLNLADSVVEPWLKVKKRNEHVAENLLNNIIEPFPGIGTINFDNSFSWEYKDKNQSDTFQVYLQGLNMINDALNHYSVNKDIRLIDKSQEIIEDWMRYIEEGNETRLTWYDHTVSARTIVLIKFIYFSNKIDKEIKYEKYFKFLNMHAEKLLDDELHRINNHGIMMDKSLIMLGIFMKNEIYYLKGYERVKSIFWQTFSDNGVHLENSPEYHNMVFRMYQEIEDYLKENDRSLGQEVIKKFNLIEEYRSHILKPDNRFPPIGDSLHTYNKYNIELSWKDFHDASAGISIIKNRKHLFYLVFICGYSFNTHKHSDDLSFILNFERKDFFVDPGKYNYSGNKYRKYIVKRQAHNSFSINRTYKKNDVNQLTKEVYTDQFFSGKTYSLVSGYIKAYEDAYLRRTLYYLHKKNVIICLDEGESKRQDTWNQRFNLSENVKIVNITKNKFLLDNKGSQIYLSIPQTEECHIVESNLKSKWPRAINSPSSGKVVATKQILGTDKEKESFSSIFFISLGKDRDIVIDKTNETIDVKVDNVHYKLPICDNFNQ